MNTTVDFLYRSHNAFPVRHELNSNIYIYIRVYYLEEIESFDRLIFFSSHLKI